ncbi:hypothetical protein MMC06_006563, partial [Schaereria dolodes]|nr:hypothetical protein [Schaereria dolodes]
TFTVNTPVKWHSLAAPRLGRHRYPETVAGDISAVVPKKVSGKGAAPFLGDRERADGGEAGEGEGEELVGAELGKGRVGCGGGGVYGGGDGEGADSGGGGGGGR